MTRALSPVPETMLWTLHNRASEAARPDGCLCDPKCLQIYRALDYDYVRHFGAADGSHGVRSQLFDERGLERDRTVIQQQTAVVQANAEAHRANTSRFVAEAQAQTTVAEANIRAHEAALRTNVAIFETEIRRYIVDGEKLIRSAALQIKALKTIAQTHATLAAGAMAGISGSAGMSGGVSSDSYSISKSI